MRKPHRKAVILALAPHRAAFRFRALPCDDHPFREAGVALFCPRAGETLSRALTLVPVVLNSHAAARCPTGVDFIMDACG